MKITALAMLLAASLAAGPASAQSPPSEVRLSLQAYEALVKAARERGGPQASWSMGELEIALPDDETPMVEVELRARVQVSGEGLGEVLVLPGDTILQHFRVDNADATLVRRGGAHVALLQPDSAQRQLSLSYLVPVKRTSDGGVLAVVPLPPLPGASFDIERGAVSAPVEIWPAGKVSDAGGTISGQLPATHAAVLRWGAGSDVVRRADYRLVLDPGSDGADITGRFEVEIEGRRAAVRLAPSTVALTDVREGTKPLHTRVVAGWHEATVVGAGRHTIEASFRIGIDRSQGQPQANLTLTRAPITRVEAQIPGKRAVTFDPEVPVTIRTSGEGEDATTSALGFLPPSDSVTIQWTEPRTAPEKLVSANTETYQLVRIEEGVMRSKVHIRYEIIRGTMKELPIALPEGVVLYKVSGEGIEDWRTFAATDDEPRQARIFLGSERDGDYALTLELEQVVPTTVGKPLQVPIVRPLEASRESGVVALFDGDKVGFAAASQSGFTKAGEDALPADIRQGLTDIVTQAFKHIGQPGTVSSAVSAAKTREIRFDARVQTLYAFQQNALEAQSTINIDVKSGRTDRIVLSLPKGVKVGSDVNAPSLKKSDWVESDGEDDRREYEILLTQALEGTFDIELNLELILPKQLGRLAVPDIRVVGADVQKGDFGIASDTGVEVTQADLAELRKIDVTELPNSVRLRSRRGVQLGYTYSYVSEPWRLELDVKRHKTVETLTAVITAAWLETTVFDEGMIVSTAVYRVDNRDQPYLRLKLPDDAKVLTVVTNGESTDAIADEDGALKIQLAKQRTSQVEVVYRSKRDKLGFMASIDLVGPKPDVFFKDFQWLVRIPRKNSIYGSDSELKEVGADDYRPPERTSASSSALGVAIQPSGEVTERLFILDVYDPGDAGALPLAVSLSTIATPGAWLNILLLLLAMIALGYAVWQRVQQRKTRTFWAVLLGGVALLVLKGWIWGLSGGEAGIAILVVLIVAVAAWVHRDAPEVADA